MHTTKGGRLLHARKILGLSQQFVADVLGIKQAGISDRERGVTDISYDECELLQAHEDIKISATWLWSGEGDMLVTGDVGTDANAGNVREDGAVYSAKAQVDTTDAGITKRFIVTLQRLVEGRGMDARNIAATIGTSASQYSQMQSGSKYMTPGMLALAVLRLGADANYILCQKEYNGERISRLEADLEKERENNAHLRELLRLKEKN